MRKFNFKKKEKKEKERKMFLVDYFCIITNYSSKSKVSDNSEDKNVFKKMRRRINVLNLHFAKTIMYYFFEKIIWQICYNFLT